MVISVRKSRDEISSEIEARGYRFLGYMIGFSGRRYPDDEVYYNERERKILWVNWMNGEWFLYEETANEPRCGWEDESVYLSEDAQYVIDFSENIRKVDFLRNYEYLRLTGENTEKYFVLVSAGDLDDGIRI